MRKKTIITSAVLLAISATTVLPGCGTKSIDISKFIEFDLKGINGKGELNASLKNMDLELEIANKKGIQDIESMNSLAEVIDIETFLSTIEIKTDDDSNNYSNGDEATVSVSYDENKAKALGINISNTKIKYKIADLKEGTLVDPFSENVFNVTNGNGIYFSSEGGYPNMTIKLTCNIPSSEALSKVKYTLYKANGNADSDNLGQTGLFENQLSGIDENDDIMITATVDESFYDSGYALSQDKKTFKAKELIGELITSLSQIDDNGWKNIGEYVRTLKTKYIDNAKDMDLFSDCLTFKTGDNDDIYLFSKAKVSDFKLDNAILYKKILNISNDVSNELDIIFSLNANNVESSIPFIYGNKDMGKVFGSFRINDIKIKNGTIIFNKSEENDFKSTRGLYRNKDELIKSIDSEKYDEGEIKINID